MVSDFLIAFNLFVASLHGGNAAVMVTYYAAQLLIVRGMPLRAHLRAEHVPLLKGDVGTQ